MNWSNFKLSPFARIMIIWLTWLTVDTIFYAICNRLGWQKGFYMTVNVGYSIGWGYPVERNHAVLWYSIFNVLVGASIVAGGLSYFLESVVSSERKWYSSTALRAKMANGANVWTRLCAYIALNRGKLIPIFAWFCWVFFMVAWSMKTVKWTFVEALYHSIASYSTGGLYAIPRESPDNWFAIVAGFTCIGVPLMGFAMANLATLLVDFHDPELERRCINSKFTAKELKNLHALGIIKEDTHIDKTEFVLLCCARLGALSPDLIESISRRFTELDYDKSGTLYLNDIKLSVQSIKNNVIEEIPAEPVLPEAHTEVSDEADPDGLASSLELIQGKRTTSLIDVLLASGGAMLSLPEDVQGEGRTRGRLGSWGSPSRNVSSSDLEAAAEVPRSRLRLGSWGASSPSRTTSAANLEAEIKSSGANNLPKPIGSRSLFSDNNSSTPTNNAGYLQLDPASPAYPIAFDDIALAASNFSPAPSPAPTSNDQGGLTIDELMF